MQAKEQLHNGFQNEWRKVPLHRRWYMFTNRSVDQGASETSRCSDTKDTAGQAGTLRPQRIWRNPPGPPPPTANGANANTNQNIG
jgi:hypothetical protein